MLCWFLNILLDASFFSYHICQNSIVLTLFPGWGFPGGSVVKNLPANAGDVSLIPDLGRFPGDGSAYPCQYSCLGNPMNRGAWWVTVCGVTESDLT